MGFCQRCGDITRGKCTKCGGRSVESTISCLVSEMGGVSIVDKWQSQYAGTILAPEEIVKKSQSTKRIPTAQSAFYTVNSKKVCSCCSKTLYHTTILQDNVPYCKECHLKLYNQGHCPSCTQPISENDAWIEHDKKKWHKHCFACFSCKKPLEANPLVDLQNRPCCEHCFMSQAGKRIYNDDSLSSNSSLSSVSSTRSSILLSKYNHSRPRLDSDLFQSLSTPPLTRTPSPEDSPLPKRLESCSYCHQTIDDERLAFYAANVTYHLIRQNVPPMAAQSFTLTVILNGVLAVRNQSRKMPTSSWTRFTISLALFARVVATRSSLSVNPFLKSMTYPAVRHVKNGREPDKAHDWVEAETVRDVKKRLLLWTILPDR
ncbi:hypothetical protein G6F56_005086 [Rhizopus delemar]|nr:hypothetical protein G6F56_005086 [Rhizopus delemar]